MSVYLNPSVPTITGYANLYKIIRFFSRKSPLSLVARTLGCSSCLTAVLETSG